MIFWMDGAESDAVEKPLFFPSNISAMNVTEYYFEPLHPLYTRRKDVFCAALWIEGV